MEASTHIHLDLWPTTPYNEPEHRGLYVSVSGNTGSGKSSLVAEIGRQCDSAGIDVLAIDEKHLHHPMFELMFCRPEEYAFPVQLNFLLQRYLVIYRHIYSGRNIVIERSHLENILFVEQHYECGNISFEELSAYLELARIFDSRIPFPDVLICLEVSIPQSIERITRDEENGVRRKCFVDESMKSRFVSDWHQRYLSFHQMLAERVSRPEMSKREILHFSSESKLNLMGTAALRLIEKLSS